MKEYIDREAFITAKRKQYCADCDRRKGMKRGKLVVCYDIGDAPCRSCGIGAVLDDVEDFPAADVVEVVRCKDCENWESDWSSCADENKHYCVMIDGFTVADFYCAYGDRKDGAVDE